MDQLLLGGTAAASAFTAVIFQRFWRRSRDPFFLYFCWSFWIETAHRIAMGLFPEFTEANPLSYVVRLVAYGLIILAIVHKNRRGS